MEIEITTPQVQHSRLQMAFVLILNQNDLYSINLCSRSIRIFQREVYL